MQLCVCLHFHRRNLITSEEKYVSYVVVQSSKTQSLEVEVKTLLLVEILEGDHCSKMRLPN